MVLGNSTWLYLYFGFMKSCMFARLETIQIS